MGKRSVGTFPRREGDFYQTPAKGVLPLLPFLRLTDVIAEPCVGAGDLTRELRRHGHAVGLQSDILNGRDALTLTAVDMFLCTIIVTNPPWSRDLLHRMIVHFSNLLPTWLLFDADWAFTRQAIPYMRRCRLIVSVGRLKWIPGSAFVGKDNCAWYHFTNDEDGPLPTFVGRREAY
jgi:hypothetical protein